MARTFSGTVRSAPARTPRRRRKDGPSSRSRVVVRTVRRGGCERCGALYHEVLSAPLYHPPVAVGLFSDRDDAVDYGRRVQARVERALGIEVEFKS